MKVKLSAVFHDRCHQLLHVSTENKAFNQRLYKNIKNLAEVATFWISFWQFFLATFLSSSEKLSSILRAQSVQAYTLLVNILLKTYKNN